ncbi:RNA-dependent RNA polymerase [Beihai rhabdo-like virus 2]|uniref:Replicase n=1 Tax=Beihai rhabdo-like virus 2 TaxID=1922652 RepID=A0A1L3KMQ6_9MONO|nr:RNA-dependent RNA polymerase [Beihai rhabdo-like virus 2]APG78672.1 RNA-dependent RNA polymerase [Beihai rhabdo-like virus 2]
MVFKPRVKFLYPRHLDEALLLDKILFYQSHPEKWEKRYPGIPHSSLTNFKSGFARGINVFHWVEREILSSIGPFGKEVGNKWAHLLSVVSVALKEQVYACFSQFPQYRDQDLTSYLRVLANNTDIRFSFIKKGLVTRIHAELNTISSQNEYPVVLPSVPGVVMFKDLVFLERFPRGGLTIPFSIFLGALDKIESSFAYQVYIHLASHSAQKEGLPYVELCTFVYNTLEQCHLELGCKSADLFKALEPLMVGLILESKDQQTNNSMFLEETLEDLRSSKPGIFPWALVLVNRLRQYIHQYGERILPSIMEQYGQEKMHYYPIIDNEEGALKMYRFGTATLPLDYRQVLTTAGFFNMYYIVKYYQKNHTLPPIVKDDSLHPLILEIYRTGNPQSMDHCRKVPFEFWRQIVFRPHLPFNYFPETLDLMDDKQTSPHREYVDQLFAADALEDVGRKPPPTRETTKLVWAILEREEIDVKSFFDQVETSGRFPEEWAVVQLKGKERELKTVAREFSIMTIEVRLMASVVEKNITDKILEFFEDQTMTDSGSQLKDRIDNIITMPTKPGHKWVMFHSDLEQWNYTFRPLLMHPFTNILNQLFGVNHFYTITKVFCESVIFTADKFVPPGTPGVFTQWNTHAGGNQGIFQKLWTLITICIIRVTMDQYQYRYHLIGSGDNQVLGVELPVTEETPRRIEEIRNALADNFSAVGLTFKAAETWYSSSLFCYQRKYYMDGIPLENGIKQATRAYAGGSDVYSGLNSIIMTAMNGGTVIAQSTPDPFVGPVFAYMEAYATILLHPDTKANQLPPVPFLALLSTLNTDFGLFPFQQFHSFLYSGHKDPLTDCLALLDKIWQQSPHLRPTIAQLVNWEQKTVDDVSNLKLVTEPQSLNIKSPPTTEAFLRGTIEEYLLTPGRVKNRHIAEVFKAYNKKDQQVFATSLLSIRPVNTGFLHSMLDNSHVGQIARTINRFTKVSSVVHTVNLNLVRKDHQSFQERVGAYDRRWMQALHQKARRPVQVAVSFLHQLTGRTHPLFLEFCKTNHLSPECTFSCRLFLTSWTFGFYPQLVLGPYQPSPVEQIQVKTRTTDLEGECSILITPAHDLPSTHRDLSTQRGPFPLLVGSKTDDPVKTIELHSLKGTESGKSVRENLRLLAWMRGNTTDHAMIEMLLSQLKARMPTIGDIIPILMGGTSGGNFQHRHMSPGEVMGSFLNSASLTSTWYQLSTNHAKRLQRGEEDRFVFFQQLFQHIMAGLRLCDPVPNRVYAIVEMRHCSYLIPENDFHLASTEMVVSLIDIPPILLSPSVIKELENEAEHCRRLLAMQKVAMNNPRSALAGIVALEFARSLRIHQLGKDQIRDRGVRGGAPQSLYNVTVLRNIDLPTLIRSIAFQCVLHQVFLNSRNYRNVIRHLAVVALKPSGLQDSYPYRALIEALITAGHLPELVRLAGGPQVWMESGSASVGLRVFLLALQKGLSGVFQHHLTTPLVIEAKNPQFHWGSLWRILGQLSNDYLHWSSTYSTTMIEAHLLKAASALPWLTITPTSDTGLVLEHARRMLKLQPDQYPSIPKTVNPTHEALPMSIPPTTNKILVVNCELMIPRGDSLPPSPVREVRSPEFQTPKMLHHIGRWAASSSGGKVKMVEIISRVVPKEMNPLMGVCLAEGAGSYASVLLHMFPQLQLVYNSLLKPERLPHCHASSFTPSEVLCLCNAHTRCHYDLLSDTCHGDLSKRQTWDHIEMELKVLDLPLDLLTWDLEGSGPSTDMAFTSLHAFILKHKPKICIIKTYLSELIGPHAAILDSWCTVYDKVQLIKPSASEVLSEEVFVVLSHPMFALLVDKSASIQGILDWWSGLMSRATAENALTEQICLAQWWTSMSPCMIASPSTGKFGMTQEHPLIINLRALCGLVLLYSGGRVSGESALDKATQHMVHSQSRGALSTLEDIQILYSSCIAYLQISNFYQGIRETGTVRTLPFQTVETFMPIFNHHLEKFDLPASQIRFARLLGEMIAVDTLPESQVVGVLLLVLAEELERKALPHHKGQEPMSLPTWIIKEMSSFKLEVWPFLLKIKSSISVLSGWDTVVWDLREKTGAPTVQVSGATLGHYEWLNLWSGIPIFSPNSALTCKLIHVHPKKSEYSVSATEDFVIILAGNTKIERPSDYFPIRCVHLPGEKKYSCFYVLQKKGKF